MAKIVWWPYYWDFLNIMAETDKTNLTFRTNFKSYIPCPKCQADYRAFFIKHRDMALKNPKGFVLHLHNYVNEKKWKPIWTADEYERLIIEKYYIDTP